MLACKVKNVDSKANVAKELVHLDHFGKSAIVVKEDMIWFQAIDTVSSLDELLIPDAELVLLSSQQPDN